jgi:RNA 2',3'-cyclic 3'-phosphodiesterase
MRLFVALEIPSELKKQLASLIKELREAAGESRGNGPRWVRPENLHLTLKFIGEAASDKVSPICNMLTRIPSSEHISLEFRGLGFFPNEKKARVLWVGISNSSQVQTLAANVEFVLEQIGIPREQRRFQPHLTLARFEPPGVTTNLRVAIARNANRTFVSLHAHEFHLIESKLKPAGAEYTTVRSFPFAKAEA